MKKGIIYLSIVWIILVIIGFLLEKNEIYSRYLVVENILNLLSFFVWIVPLLLIFLIKKKMIRNVLLACITGFILYNGTLILFLGMFYINDLLIGNGYRQIFEKEISGNKYFSIYRTPDKGALGGDYRTYTIDKKLWFGFVQRHELNSNEYETDQDIQNNSKTIIIGTDTIYVDDKTLEGKGDL